MAFAWLGWISLTALIGVSAVLAVQASSSGGVRWKEHAHSKWGFTDGSKMAHPMSAGAPGHESLATFRFPVQATAA